MRAQTSLRGRLTYALLGTTLAALTLAAGSAMAAGGPGAVYIQSNSVPNFVHVFPRAADGTLATGPVVATGGAGATVTPPLGFPIADSQGSVVLSQDGRLLFATNAGSNTVSSFRVTKDGLVLADQEASRGVLPISATVTNRGVDQKLLYVLNENPVFPCLPFPFGCGTGPGNVSGYSVDSSGEMTPLAGGVKAVSGSLSAQVGFDSHGSTITVTNRGNNTISTYVVGQDGTLGSERVRAATGHEPFGFEYTKRNQLLVSNSGTPPEAPIGSASSYDLDAKTGVLTAIDEQFSGGLATCWVALTDDNRYAFMTNALTGNISRFAVSPGGELSLLGISQAPGFALDLDTSRDSRYLYVLTANVTFDTGLPVFGTSQVTGYAIGHDGSLAPIGTNTSLLKGASGLAAR